MYNSYTNRLCWLPVVLQSLLINTVYNLLMHNNKWDVREGGEGGGLIKDLRYFVEFNCHSCKQLKVEKKRAAYKKNILGLHVHVQEDPSLQREYWREYWISLQKVFECSMAHILDFEDPY